MKLFDDRQELCCRQEAFLRLAVHQAGIIITNTAIGAAKIALTEQADSEGLKAAAKMICY